MKVKTKDYKSSQQSTLFDSNIYSSVARLGQRHRSDWTGADVPPVGGAHGDAHPGAVSHLRDLRRENGRLQDQLRGSEELNTTLRSELDLHRSIMAQTSARHQERAQDQDASTPRTRRREGDVGSHKNAAEQPRSMDAGKHVAKVESIRLHLTIHNNNNNNGDGHIQTFRFWLFEDKWFVL